MKINFRNRDRYKLNLYETCFMYKVFNIDENGYEENIFCNHSIKRKKNVKRE